MYLEYHPVYMLIKVRKITNKLTKLITFCYDSITGGLLGSITVYEGSDNFNQDIF